MNTKNQKIDEILEQNFNAIPDLIRLQAFLRPDHAALIQDDNAITYAQLDALMDRVAAALQRDGFKPCDAIAICAATSPQYAAAFLGGLRAGLAVAPLAPSSSAESLASMMVDAGARVVFADEAVANVIAPECAQRGIGIIALDNSACAKRFDDWLAPVGAVSSEVQIQPQWPFNIIYSSGTTGAPKGIVQPHSMRWKHVQRGCDVGYGIDAVTVLSTPLYSNTTLVSFFPTITLGGTVVLMAKFDAGKYLALAEKYRATHTMLVPVQYQRLMARPDFERYDLSSFRMKFSTSAPFTASLKADILRRWPGALVEYYGMTEGGGTCILNASENPNKLHTVGMPAAGHDIRLIDEEGREVPVGEAGEVVGHSPAMMVGYHNQPAKTVEAEWHDPSGKRFIRTGDIGRFDADGFLTRFDRKKDMIISGGFNVYPSDLEAVLNSHAEVLESAVVGVPSERWGETPVAFVVLKDSASVKHSDLLDWTNARLGKTQRLAALEITSTLPRSPIGKVLKRELRESFKFAHSF
jgi:long-chain acyl-CoA synthetase